MKILAVDTSTRICSVAVVENQALLAELTLNHGHTHSTHLMPMIETLLNQCRLSVHDLDAFAVTVGPGSFTGLRIGISTVKGLAYGASKPVTGVSALEALAYQFPFASSIICPMIDARKGEVYTAGYRFVDGALAEAWPPTACAPSEVLENIPDTCLFVGNGARLYKDLISDAAGSRAFFAPLGQDYIRAVAVGLLGYQLINRRQETPLADLNPWYIRPSDAEKMLFSAGSD